MKKNYTHISVLLDRSGSMQSIKDDTEGGFKNFLTEQRALSGEATIELRQFDSEYEQVYGPTPIQDAQELVLVPRGSTALLDAMGKSITETGEWLASLSEDERPDNVVFVIITDGWENASREWTREKVFKLVKQQTDQWHWTFLYLGANQDAIQAGASIGINANTSLTYDPSNTGQTYSVLSASTTRVRGGKPAAFTDQERKESRSS